MGFWRPGDYFLVTVGTSTPRTEQGCPSLWLWTLCQIAPCRSWPTWGEGNEERPQTEGSPSLQGFTKGWKYLSHSTGGLMVGNIQSKMFTNDASSWQDAFFSFLPQLCSCRCCDPSEGPGHLRLLLELCHYWSSRGRSLPKGEKDKKQLAAHLLATFQCFQPIELLLSALWSHICSAWRFICSCFGWFASRLFWCYSIIYWLLSKYLRNDTL